MKVKELPLDQILPPETPVRTVASEEAMEELMASMEKYGLLEPVVVIQEGEYYRLVAGHRRLIAAKGLGWKKIACNVLNVDPQTGALISLEENIKREAVNPVDEAHYYLHLIKNHGMTQTEIANRLGKHKQEVHNRIALLDLDPTTLDMVQQQDLSMTHALELRRITDVEQRANIRAHVMTYEMTALATRHLVDQVVALGPDVTPQGEVVMPQVPPGEEPVGHYKCAFCDSPGRDVRLHTLFVCNFCLRALREGAEEAARKDLDM